MREFLRGLELDEELIDTIMAEHGKLVTKDKETLMDLKKELADLKENSKGSDELQKKYDELKSKYDEENKKKKEEEQDKNILNEIGDKKFVNDYTKNSILGEIKKALSDKQNEGKSIKDIFKEITKDKEGIFANPNKPVSMAGANSTLFNNVDKQAFSKMGYKDRINLKAENPDLFAELNASEESTEAE